MTSNGQKGGKGGWSKDRGSGAGSGSGGVGGRTQGMAWDRGGWEEDEVPSSQGAGRTLVHETHAPKRISHIQFGLLNSEVRA